jgi:hypothetical protein
MTIPLPSLNLSYSKSKNTSTQSTSSASNNVNVNLYPPLQYTPQPSPIMTRRNSIRGCDTTRSLDIEVPEPLIPLTETPRPRSLFVQPDLEKDRPPTRTNTPVIPNLEDTPPYDSIVSELKDTLISFNSDLLTNDFDLIRNIRERGDKVVYRKQQLQVLIAILMTGDKNKADLVDIETEIFDENCHFCTRKNIFYRRIKSIHVNKTVSFLSSEYSVRLQSVFKINLDRTIVS